MNNNTMDPWTKLGTGAILRRGPPRFYLTKDTPVGTLKPSPEVVEHMIEDLEDKLSHYFNLYIRERKDKEMEQEKATVLKASLEKVYAELDSKNKKLEQLEGKIKELFVDPQNIKETMERIDLIYVHLDTLINAFIGIGTCATLNGLNKNIFTKIALEYLYPCRNLDARLDALYSALYSLLLTSNTNDGFFGQSSNVPLEGFCIRISEIVFENSNNVPNQITVSFRYDHEDFIKMAKADVVEGVANVNLDFKVGLPPKKPGKIPKFVLDIWSESDSHIASSSVSLIDPVLLESDVPWNLVDNNVCIATVKVTVTSNPQNARMPAERFRVAKEFAHVHKGAKPLIDYHLLHVPDASQLPNNKDIAADPASNTNTEKPVQPKPVVTTKVVKPEPPKDNKPTAPKDSKAKENKGEVKENKPTVPAKAVMKKAMRPLPKKTTPLPRPKQPARKIPENKDNEEGILQTLIDSQPEKVASIDNSANYKLKDVAETKDKDKGEVQDAMGEDKGGNTLKSSQPLETEEEVGGNLGSHGGEEQSKDVEVGLKSTSKDEVGGAREPLPQGGPAPLVERKLSTKKSNVPEEKKEGEESSEANAVKKLPLPKIKLQPKNVLTNTNADNKSNVKAEEEVVRKSQLISLVPLAKPIALTKPVLSKKPQI